MSDSQPQAQPNLGGTSQGSDMRFSGLWPNRWLRFRRPLWWQEILIIALGYIAYGQVRNAIPNKTAIAQKHARGVQHLQEFLHLNWELSINRFVAAHEAIAQVMNYYYATLHFVVTVGVLVWLFISRPALYRGVRTVLFITSLIALVGFYLYPLAPPRLMPQYGYVDTLLKFHTWGSLADPNIAQHSNQFAAMPSLHIGWALWCGITIAVCARRRWVKLLGMAYPLATLTVIVGTANHYFIDAVGGVVVVMVGFTAQYLMSGHSAFVAPQGTPRDLRYRRQELGNQPGVALASTHKPQDTP